MTTTRREFLLSAALACTAGSGATVQANEGATPVPLALVAARRGTGPAISYDGTATGPVIRIRKGTTLAVTLDNQLAEATSLCWHGLRSPEDAATRPDTLSLAPSATAAVRLTPPDSGLFWFHAAALPGMSDQTAAGLFGVLVVEEPDAPVVDRDLLLVLATPPGTDAPTVNGAAAPLRDTLASGSRLRLRVLNASTSRIMVLAIEGARPKIIAIDGQPCDLFEPVRDAVPVGPGARFEFMIDASRAEGDTLRMSLRGAGTGDGPRLPDTLLLEITTKGAARDPSPPIAALPRNPMLPPAIPLERSARADCVIEPVSSPAAGAPRWRINGTAALALPDRPLLSVRRGATVTLGLINRSSVAVPIRVHGQAMRLLHARDDGWEPYWRDSVILPPASTNHVAFVAGGAGRWPIDSTIFDQAVSGLRTLFEVT